MAGHIKKRKYADGRVKWRARYPNPSKPGTTAQFERTFDRRADAERWLTDKRASVQRGEHIDPRATRTRFAELVEAWRGTWIELEPRTKQSYESLLQAHVLRRWGEVRLEGMTPETIQKWINELAEDRAPNTVRRIYTALRSVLKIAVERRYLTANPCDSVRLPRKRSAGREQLYLSAEQVADLADAISPHFRTLVFTAAYTGLRAGELAGLRRRDIEVTGRQLHVRQALKTVGRDWSGEDGDSMFGVPKSGKARTVGLPRFLGDMLAAHLIGTADSPEPDPDALVFRSLEGAPLRQGNFYRRHFKPAVREALPKRLHGLRFHDLRHTAASLLIDAGVHPKAIQEHLGHRDITTTLNVYGHRFPSAREALAAALDATYAAAEQSGTEQARVS